MQRDRFFFPALVVGGCFFFPLIFLVDTDEMDGFGNERGAPACGHNDSSLLVHDEEYLLC